MKGLLIFPKYPAFFKSMIIIGMLNKGRRVILETYDMDTSQASWFID